MDLSGSGYRQVAGPCKSSNKMRGISWLAEELLAFSKTLFHAVTSSSSSYYYYYYYYYYCRRRECSYGLQD